MPHSKSKSRIDRTHNRVSSESAEKSKVAKSQARCECYTESYERQRIGKSDAYAHSIKRIEYECTCGYELRKYKAKQANAERKRANAKQASKRKRRGVSEFSKKRIAQNAQVAAPITEPKPSFLTEQQVWQAERELAAITDWRDELRVYRNLYRANIGLIEGRKRFDKEKKADLKRAEREQEKERNRQERLQGQSNRDTSKGWR